MFKKYAKVVLALALTITTFGCGPKVENGSKEQEGKIVITLDIGGATTSGYNDKYAVKKIEELFDVVLTPVTLDTEKKQLALASNTLPDISAMYASQVKDSGDLFLDLTPYLDKELSNVNSYINKYKKFEYSMKTDGKFYIAPFIIQDRLPQQGWMINQTMLEELGLKAPDTFDDLYEVCKAWKAANPTKYPLNGGETLFGIKSGFILLGHDYVEETDEFMYQWLKPEAKDLVAYCQKLYNEGLLDPEYLTNGDNNIVANYLNRNTLLSAGWWLSGAIPAPGSNLNDESFTDKIVGMLPPKNAQGRRVSSVWYGDVTGVGMVINSALAKEPQKLDKALQIIDWSYSREGIDALYYGEEGLTYTIEGNGTRRLTDDFMYALRNPQAADKKFNVDDYNTYISSIDETWPQKNDGEVMFTIEKMLALPRSEMAKFYLYPFASLTSQQDEEVNNLYRDCGDYADSQFNAFVMQNKPIDEWDQVTETLKIKGGEKIGEIKTKAYQEWKKTPEYQAWLNN